MTRTVHVAKAHLAAPGRRPGLRARTGLPGVGQPYERLRRRGRPRDAAAVTRSAVMEEVPSGRRASGRQGPSTRPESSRERAGGAASDPRPLGPGGAPGGPGAPPLPRAAATGGGHLPVGGRTRAVTTLPRPEGGGPPPSDRDTRTVHVGRVLGASPRPSGAMAATSRGRRPPGRSPPPPAERRGAPAAGSRRGPRVSWRPPTSPQAAHAGWMLQHRPWVLPWGEERVLGRHATGPAERAPVCGPGAPPLTPDHSTRTGSRSLSGPARE